MSKEATARWRRRGWHAFVEGLPTVLPRQALVVLGVVTIVLAAAGAVGAVWAFEGDPVARSVLGGISAGVSLAALVGAVACISRSRRAGRGLRRVRVLDEGLLFASLGDDDVVTADAAAVDKLGRLVAGQRAALPPLMLCQLLLGVGGLGLLLAVGVLGLSWFALAGAPFTVLGAITSVWSLCDASGRTETVAAALADGTVVEPAPGSRRPTATWHD